MDAGSEEESELTRWARFLNAVRERNVVCSTMPRRLLGDNRFGIRIVSRRDPRGAAEDKYPAARSRGSRYSSQAPNGRSCARRNSNQVRKG